LPPKPLLKMEPMSVDRLVGRCHAPTDWKEMWSVV